MDGTTTGRLPDETGVARPGRMTGKPGFWSRIDALVRDIAVGGLAGVTASGLVTFTSIPFSNQVSWMCAGTGAVVSVGIWVLSLVQHRQDA